ncbi:hypothetical protein DSM106972_048850 [Dulcicalothrix desertica PCC 7102]|uniref:Transmembrane protein n=1 Tax=Dulcicalothrix desertica PCC 7102 TaxID=232991 RepID=A0A433VCY1_9CYAN|nr:hypothetical protein [Dulcicalothrix desertica]RUT03971.1 hypothetical protein DSM106972_048850 [Dulcicalothrix desertica PCC 7102]TWH43622.1 hypothetical protein CAL7102_07359 [Dulcicalothrix desertica PCC 7102]
MEEKSKRGNTYLISFVVGIACLGLSIFNVIYSFKQDLVETNYQESSRTGIVAISSPGKNLHLLCGVVFFGGFIYFLYLGLKGYNLSIYIESAVGKESEDHPKAQPDYVVDNINPSNQLETQSNLVKYPHLRLVHPTADGAIPHDTNTNFVAPASKLAPDEFRKAMELEDFWHEEED